VLLYGSNIESSCQILDPELGWGFWVDVGSILVGAKKYMAFLQLRYRSQYKAHAKTVCYRLLEKKFIYSSLSDHISSKVLTADLVRLELRGLISSRCFSVIIQSWTRKIVGLR